MIPHIYFLNPPSLGGILRGLSILFKNIGNKNLPTIGTVGYEPPYAYSLMSEKGSNILLYTSITYNNSFLYAIVDGRQ